MDDNKEIKNDKMNESLLKIEVLQKEYDVTLQKYQEAVQNYINSLENSLSSSSSKDSSSSSNFTALEGRSWWGTEGLNEGTVNNQAECISMCASDGKCSGATFNPVKRYCWTRTGDGKISTGLDTDYALVTTQTAAMSVMIYLNEQLLSLNKKLTTELADISPQIKEQMDEKNKKEQELNIAHQKLLEQKNEMESEMLILNSINKNNENQSLFTNEQNISNRVWVLITFLVLWFTIRKMFNLPSPSFSFVIWLIIISIFIILTFNLTTSGGFLLCFGVLTMIILMRTDNLPSP
jgi:hypothetical protein